MEKFCYLGDMLSVDGDADAAVDTEFKLDGINLGIWYHCLPIRMYSIIDSEKEIVQQLCAK